MCSRLKPFKHCADRQPPNSASRPLTALKQHIALTDRNIAKLLQEIPLGMVFKTGAVKPGERMNLAT
jgi:hypothetical protein